MSQNKPVPAPERVVLRRRLAVLMWRAVAVLGLTLGLLGVVLPVAQLLWERRHTQRRAEQTEAFIQRLIDLMQ